MAILIRTSQDKIIQQLESIVARIKKYNKKNIPVEIEIKGINTGITEGPSSMGWRQFYDLGGRQISININFPNTKTLKEAIKKY